MKRSGLIANIVIAAIILQFALFHTFWLNSTASLLIHQDKLAPADAILALGGGTRERVDQAIALYKGNYAGTILFTGMLMEHGWRKPVTHWAVEAKKIAVGDGVPENNVVPLFGSRSTFDDATLAKTYCLAHGCHSLIVVSEPYHTMRAHHVFAKVFKDSGIRIVLYPVQNSWYTIDSWWYSGDGLMLTASEYVKFLVYLARGRLAF